MRNGILVAGNWIIDHVKVIDIYPEENKLANILAEYSSNGGSAFNVLKALYKLGVKWPLSGIGLIGDDERGNIIIADCKKMAVNTDQIYRTDQANTSYTDVMTVQSSGKRTFFHQRGANDLLDKVHFDFAISDSKIFHLGYLLLLEKLDLVEADGTTAAAKVLKKAKEHGLITSVDIVSESSDRFKKVIPSSLPFVDYLFINEFEAQMLAGVPTTTSDGEITVEGCYEAASKIMEMGVREWVVLHFPQGAIALNRKKEKLYQPSIKLPVEKIRGAVGAGDAFAAGVLTGIHDNLEMGDCLRQGVCAAATSLFENTSSDGILPLEECLQLVQLYSFIEE